MNLKQIVVLVLVALIAVGGCKKKTEEAPAVTPPPPAAEPAAEAPATPPAEAPATPPAEAPATPPAEGAATAPAEGGGCTAYVDRMVACAKEMAAAAGGAVPFDEAAVKQANEMACQVPTFAAALEGIGKCTQTNCMEWMSCVGQAQAAAMGIPGAPTAP